MARICSELINTCLNQTHSISVCAWLTAAPLSMERKPHRSSCSRQVLEECEQTQQHLETATLGMKESSNQHWGKIPRYTIVDRVWLTTQDLWFSRYKGHVSFTQNTSAHIRSIYRSMTSLMNYFSCITAISTLHCMSITHVTTNSVSQKTAPPSIPLYFPGWASLNTYSFHVSLIISLSYCTLK